MATTTMVHVRVEERIKAQATKALAAMGLSVSDAVRVLLMRVAAEKQLPFALKVPNAETRNVALRLRPRLRPRRRGPAKLQSSDCPSPGLKTED